MTCTARKTADALPMAQMRNVHGVRLATRVKDWFDRIGSVQIDRRPAKHLYCGSAWLPVTKLLSDSTLRIWIISAGHGLITTETEISPYAATFTNDHPDSVIPQSETRFTTSDWWMACASRGANTNEPRTISEIASKFPKAPLIIALSSEYLKAVEKDLTEARSMLSIPDLLVIISSGAKKAGDLEPNLLPCDSRMEWSVGRGRSALNARILRKIVTENRSKLRSSLLRDEILRIQKSLPPANYPDRTQTSDDEVRQFILARIKAGGPASHSRFLREYRSTGRACEQSRFRSLFLEIAN